MNETDLELLRRYLRQNAEEAFAEVVRRHLDLVYSAALRQVRSPQLAEEVVQTVFVELARSAPRLAPDTVLEAWLYEVTRRTAVDVIRREARRQLREQVAAEMSATNAASNEWDQIEPLLDEAMQALNEAERIAILLRYFENKSLREIGQALGTSDDTAQKRVSRAVERLREFFAKRGVTAGTGGLVSIITANAVQTAPAGLAANITAAVSLVGTALATTTATATATKTIAMTTVAKAIAISTVVVSLTTALYQAHQASTLRTKVQTAQQQQTQQSEHVKQLTRERDATQQQLAVLRKENEQLNQNTSELLKLRGEVTQLRIANKELAKLQALTNSNPPSEVRPAVQLGSYISKEQLAPAGYATPEAALQTMFWTALNGTCEQFVQSLVPKEQTQALLSELPEQWPKRQKEMSTTMRGMQIMAKKVLGENKVELKVKLDANLPPPTDDSLPDISILPMMKVGNEWKGVTSSKKLTTTVLEKWESEGVFEPLGH